jgi:hypothetical protein
VDDRRYPERTHGYTQPHCALGLEPDHFSSDPPTPHHEKAIEMTLLQPKEIHVEMPRRRGQRVESSGNFSYNPMAISVI